VQGSPGVANATGVVISDFAPTMGFTNVQGAIYALKSVLAPGSTPTAGLTAYTINTVARYHYMPGVAGKQVSNSTGYVGIGGFQFNPSNYYPGVASQPQHVKFQAIMETATGVTASLQLYNLSVGTGISGSQLYTTNPVPTFAASADLSLPVSDTIYEVQLKIQAGTSTDQAVVKMARLEISHG
jgi:hypothetical protein